MADGFSLTSSAFEPGVQIPRKHTCDGDDVSPPLAWANAPSETRSLALVVDDPDAPSGTFTHWLAWGLPPDAAGLAEGEKPPVEGRNDFGRTGYGGPCPPRGGGAHRYFFRLSALDADLELASGAGKADVERLVGEHELAVAELMGTYERA
jgi:Raf kinase inhibitor-like YbhB/YbcL family protein